MVRKGKTKFSSWKFCYLVNIVHEKLIFSSWKKIRFGNADIVGD